MEPDELRRLLDEATPRPWRVAIEEGGAKDDMPIVGQDDDFLCISPDDGVQGGHAAADAALIVAAVNALPELLDAADEADRIRARLAALEDGLRALADSFGPDHDGHDFTHGYLDCEGCIHAELRALLDAPAPEGGGE